MLRKNILRDIKEQKGSFLALCLIIASGMCLYVSMFMVSDSLFRAIGQYYQDSRFGDAFAEVVSISRKDEQKLTEIAGIDQVTIRYTRDVRVLFDGNEENVFVRLISFDPERKDDLNLPHLFAGIPVAANTNGIYISPAFAEANALAEGDVLPLLINGKRRALPIAGIAQSPEYIYAVSGKSEVFPNAALFGAVLVPEELMGQMFDTYGMGNSIAVTLEAGYHYQDVEVLLKDRLERYGLKTLVEREDQMSHFMLMEEAKQLETMGNSIPLLMILISSVILVITLRRRVEMQRGQIGILLAFGYTRIEILLHYLLYGLFVGIVGGILGNLMGIGILNGMVELYKKFFNIPGFKADIVWKYLLYGMMISVGGSVAACAFGCREIMKLQPVEAMRPPAPAIGRAVFIEKIRLFWGLLTTPGKMAVRNMVRSPFRSMISLIGVSLVFALMAVVFAFNNMLDVMIVDQYEKVEVYDAKITFDQFLEDSKVQQELSHYSGITLAETVLEVPCQARNQNLSVDTVVMGVAEDARLYHILGADQKEVKLSGSGAVLSENLAAKLDAKPGTILYLDTTFTKDPVTIMVTKVVPQYLGANIYLEKEALWELIGVDNIASSAMVLAGAETISAFKSEYLLSEKLSGISRPDEMFKMVTDYMDSYRVLIYVMGIAVSLIGFVIVYNSAVISFSERARELASLMVLGLTEREVVQVISFEQWLLSSAGAVIGVPMAYMLNQALAKILQNDIYMMPDEVPASAIILAFVMTCAYLYLAQIRIHKKVKKLVIVEVLKERE